MQLTLEDGGPNDADGRRNRVIKDPGGVGMSPQAAVEADNQVSSSSSGSGGGGGGGGGGCTAGTRGSVDPLLPLMVLLSVVGLMCRRPGHEHSRAVSEG